MVGQFAPTDLVAPDLVADPATGRHPILQDTIAVTVLLALFFVVHDVKTMLTSSYWLDEAWVALSVRFPVGDLPVTTSSTPLGWTFLLRLVPDADYLRVVPLAFHLIAVVAAYALGGLLSWRQRGYGILGGVVCGATVLLLPVQQIRHDLKQYTADAAVTLVLLALSAWTERTWSRKRLGVLTAAVAVGMLVSHVTAVTASCVFGGLVLAAAVSRQRRRLVEVLVAGLGAGLIVVAVYFGVSSRNRGEALQQYWLANFPGVTELPGYLHRQIGTLMPFVGAPALVVVALLAAGVWTLARRGRAGTATAVLLLPIAAITVGVAKAYPLLELRTSHFLLVTAAAVAGLGVAGTATAAATLARRALPRMTHAVAATAICAVLLGTFAVGNARWYRFDGHEPGLYRTSIAIEDIRSATEYVAAHRSPNDVIVVSSTAGYGFAFYWRQEPLRLLAPTGNTVGWQVSLPTAPGVVFIPSRDAHGIRRGLDTAMGLANQRGPDTRIWLIRSHVVDQEPDDWRSVLAAYRVELVTDGVEPVALISKK